MRVISVAMLGGGADAAAYYLQRSADCDLAEYYTGEVERPGSWCGHGAAALNLSGAIAGEAGARFAGLLAGQLPDGTIVSRPVLRADPRGLLAAEPLVRELRRAAGAAGGEVGQLFTGPDLAQQAMAFVARVDAARPSQRGRVRVDAFTAGEIAAAAGLNPHVLYPMTRHGGGYDAGLRCDGAKVDVRRSGLDVVVSAPKSVSVLYGLADPAVAQTVATAHERAVDQALDYLERHTAHGLRGHHGDGQRAARIGTDGFVAAAFTHRTSRADDPQLHTHVVIANLVHGADGAWSAVDSRAVHRQARTAGCIYQAVLRGELTRTLGVGWGPVRKGVAEIDGIPAGLRRAFSRRREQIEAETERTGTTSRRARQRASYRTRPAKTHTAEPSLRHRWAQRAIDVGHDPRALVISVLGRTRSPELPAAEVVARQLFGPAGVTDKRTSFDRREVIQALTETLPSGLPITGTQLEAAADRMLHDPEAIRLLDPSDGDGNGPRWTSADLLRTEGTALALAGHPTRIPVHEPERARGVAGGAGLSGEQQRLVTGLLTSSRTVDVVVGPAGSGKTALLRAAATGWHEVNAPVLGCALSAVTARRLEAATGIPTSSVARLLYDTNRVDPQTGQGSGLAARTVVVVDEASMVGTRDLATLAVHVARAGGKLVLVGDPAQLPEIDAGGLFAALARHAEPLALTVNQRQQHGWERAALLALRDGDAATALDAYFAHHRVAVGTDQHDARAQLVDAYVQRRLAEAGPFDLVALASTRADVTTLNTQIRGRLQHHGVIASTGTTVLTGDGPREFGAGDLVVVTRNDHPRRLLNGTRATITRTSSHELDLSTEAGATTRVSTAWAAEHLDHGYALTVHKAQGLTTATALVYGTSALGQQAGYVALSRGRHDNHLFTSADSLDPERHDVDVPRFRVLDLEPPDVYDALAERLSHGYQQVLAHQQQPDFDDEPDRWLSPHDHHQHSRDGHGLSL